MLLLIAGQPMRGQALRAYEVGEWRLKLGLPYLNSFYLQPKNETPKSETGWIGLEGGVEYQHGERRFACLEYSLNGAAPVPLGVVDIEGEFDAYLTNAIAITENRTLGRFSIGYGLSVAANTWTYTRTFVPDTVQPTRELVTRTSKNIGLALNTYYRMGRALHLGFIYRPYFFKFDSADPWQYEHVISVDVMWRIHFRKKPKLK